MSAVKLERLLSLAQPDAEVHRWLASALAEWRRGGISLDRSLGLTGPVAIRARDAALRRAAALLDDGRTPWETAGKLERAINHFETTAWKRLRYQAPPDLPPLKLALYEAFMVAELGRLQMLRCRRALWNLIR